MDHDTSAFGGSIRFGLDPGACAATHTTVPRGRFGTPEEAAGAVHLFCASESDHVSGQTLVIGAGFK